ncbi:MAG: GntR family transcriptional regulator [Anaerolineales bacterium]
MTIPELDISLAERAYVRLRQEILNCDLAPGQMVSERELARRYDMSKTPIREALSQVCHDGLMHRLPGRGYMVAPITVKDIQDIFDLRLILELAAAKRAAENPSPKQIATLKELAGVRYSLDDRESHIAFLRTNRTFHLTLAEAAENQRLVDRLEELLIEMDRIFHLGLRLRDSSEEMVREHQEVVAALEIGDVEGIQDAIARQIIASRDRVMESILQGELQPVQVSG